MKMSIDIIGCEYNSNLEMFSAQKEILKDVLNVRIGDQDAILCGLSSLKQSIN